jgi:uncharacterized protein (DUF1697 family)
MRYAALLRGINLGKRRVGMADLRRILASEGMESVATYLQSGNAVFSTGRQSRDKVRQEVERVIAAEFGFEVPVVLVTGPEISSVIKACPYRKEGDEDPTKVHVTFVEPMPPADVIAQIDLDAVAPEHLALGPGVIYMHLPNGMGRAVLPDLLARKTTTVTATTRNWRTVLALAEMV